MFEIYRPWDRLSAAVVGSAWSPARFDWVEISQIRRELEIIAQETQEDLDNLASMLTSLGVEVYRPNMDLVSTKALPPVAPRDDLLMLNSSFCVLNNERSPGYQHIVDLVQEKHNPVVRHNAPDIHSANVYDLGDCIYYSVDDIQHISQSENWFAQHCPDRNRRRYYNIGHLDGWWCAPVPGIIAASRDHTQHALQQLFFRHHFPDWQVIYLNETFAGVLDRTWCSDRHPAHSEFAIWANSNISSWLGCASETVFEINMLVIDQTLVITGQDHAELRDTLKQKGCHLLVAPLRHQTFWDLGIHCATADLARIRNSH